MLEIWIFPWKGYAGWYHCTDFESDSDDLECDQDKEKDEVQGKYSFLQNHPLYETHQGENSASQTTLDGMKFGLCQCKYMTQK